MPHNSHGAVLDRFVLEHPDCAYYLFLDSDVVFTQDDTLYTMLAELEADETAFGVGARMSWDGESEMPADVRDENPDIYTARLHPCCALVRNTPAFRRVVAEIGLGCAKLLHPDREEHLDTFKLATKAMRTHGYRHIRSATMVLHFFCVSYDPRYMESKNRRRDALLAELRQAAA
jgi:GT2 family glycosyltransferase